MFVDRVKLHLHAGRGGQGCISFRREKYIPRGGPDGGDGGRGGSVILVATPGVDSLANLAHMFHWRAGHGANGQGSNRSGGNAEDVRIAVPPGTLVIDCATGLLLRDLSRPGDEIEICAGGRGGKGNAHFKSSTHQAPRVAQPGEAGESRLVILELKVIADVGLIGKPNAGKSTLLSRLSRARPEIADYPFTTKHPNLGQVHVDADRSFVLADIPGLIEGAHAGVGLGHEFLRHVERAGLLVHLVEPQPVDGSDPTLNYQAIRAELGLYDAQLAERREIVAITKSELPGAEEVRAALAATLGREVLALSAVTGQGLNVLVARIAAALAEAKQATTG